MILRSSAAARELLSKLSILMKTIRTSTYFHSILSSLRSPILIKNSCRQRNSQFAEVRLIDSSESSEDEIMVVSEKITAKTKMRLQMRQQKRQLRIQQQLAAAQARGRGRGRGRPRGRGAGRPPSSNNSVVRKVEVVKADTLSLEDDDDDLTCRICMSSFWYKSQIIEHLSKTHSVKDPEAFIKEKRRRV